MFSIVAKSSKISTGGKTAMKKSFLLVVFVIAALIGLFAKANLFAANPDTFIINVTCQRQLSVNVTTSTLASERDAVYTATISSSDIPTNASIVISTPLAVWNNSPVYAASIQNYSLQVTAGSTALLDDATAWDPSNGSGVADRWVIAGIFTNSSTWNPATTEFSSDTGDVIPKGSAKSWVAGGGNFSPATVDYRYANEAAHPRNTSAADLLLWIGIGSPAAASSSGYNPSFTITVTAL